MTGLWIAVGIVLAMAGLWWLAHLARTTVEPYTAVSEQDESFLTELPARTQLAPHDEAVRHQATVGDQTVEWGGDIPAGAVVISTDFEAASRSFLESVTAGHTESFGDFDARLDRMNRSAREARARFNQQQGDPQ